MIAQLFAATYPSTCSTVTMVSEPAAAGPAWLRGEWYISGIIPKAQLGGVACSIRGGGV